MGDNQPTFTEWTAVRVGHDSYNIVKGAPGEYVHAASAQDAGLAHKLVALLNELDDLRHWRDVEVRRIAAADDRIAEHNREVERRDEYLAGADADLKAEREKTAALRALLEECQLALTTIAETDGLTAVHCDLVDRIRKELGR